MSEVPLYGTYKTGLGFQVNVVQSFELFPLRSEAVLAAHIQGLLEIKDTHRSRALQ